MIEAQILPAIENFMHAVTQPDYRWRNFKSDYKVLIDDAKSIYSSYRQYTPLVQSYFDLLPERINKRDEMILYSERVFNDFQHQLRTVHNDFLHNFRKNNRRNQCYLLAYFNALVERHRKLLLVRVDLHYRSVASPGVYQFNKDIEKMLQRIQNKNTIFENQVGYAYRLEQGGRSRGYHCHLLVIYNGSLRMNDNYLGNQIGQLWCNQITRGTGEYYNCNQSAHKKRYKQRNALGIGMIERRDEGQVQNAHLAISYLANPEKNDQYLRGKLVGMREFGKGQLRR